MIKLVYLVISLYYIRLFSLQHDTSEITVLADPEIGRAHV